MRFEKTDNRRLELLVDGALCWLLDAVSLPGLRSLSERPRLRLLVDQGLLPAVADERVLVDGRTRIDLFLDDTYTGSGVEEEEEVSSRLSGRVTLLL